MEAILRAGDWSGAQSFFRLYLRPSFATNRHNKWSFLIKEAEGQNRDEEEEKTSFLSPLSISIFQRTKASRIKILVRIKDSGPIWMKLGGV